MKEHPARSSALSTDVFTSSASTLRVAQWTCVLFASDTGKVTLNKCLISWKAKAHAAIGLLLRITASLLSEK